MRVNSTFKSLRNRNYRIYAVGSLISNIGSWFQITAQDWLVLQLTHSGSMLGLVTALQMLPTLLFSAYAGVLADRMPKRRWLMTMELVLIVPSGLLGVLAVTGLVQVWHVLVLAFCFGLARALEAPVRQSYVSEMVGPQDLQNAVGLNSASFNSARLVGPGLAGLMIAALGSGVLATGWVIILNAVSYLFVVASLALQDSSQLLPGPVGTRRGGAVREGIAYVRSRPDLVMLLTSVFFLGAFGMNFQITSALMATQVFHRGAGEYGILGSVLAIGSLTGALLAARRTTVWRGFVVVGALVFSVVQIASSLMPTYWAYAATLPFIGISLMTTMTTAQALIQTTTDAAVRGRVLALYMMVFMGSTPLGAPIIGWLAQVVSPRDALVVSGLGTGVGVSLTALWYLRTTGQRVGQVRRRIVAARTQPSTVDVG